MLCNVAHAYAEAKAQETPSGAPINREFDMYLSALGLPPTDMAQHHACLLLTCCLMPLRQTQRETDPRVSSGTSINTPLWSIRTRPPATSSSCHRPSRGEQTLIRQPKRRQPLLPAQQLTDIVAQEALTTSLPVRTGVLLVPSNQQRRTSYADFQL